MTRMIRLIWAIALVALCVVVVIDLLYVFRRIRTRLRQQRPRQDDHNGYLRPVPPRRDRHDRPAS